ncbi:MAG: hypothetical protein IKO96_04780, partial [Spirochaetales bacterium]|nr:hypothetical protein [Spirochaetales bacterium]
ECYACRTYCSSDELIVIIGSVVADKEGRAFYTFAGFDHVELELAEKTGIDAGCRIIKKRIGSFLEGFLMLHQCFFLFVLIL